MAFDRDGLLVARVTTTIVHKGRRYPIRKGVTVVHSDDSVVQGRERLFEPLKVTRLGARAARATETATAGPGELRDVRLPHELDGGEVTPAETSGAEGRAGSTPAGTASSSSFNPGEHTVAQVNGYLAGVGLDERARVIQAECEGQSRRGVIQGPYSDLAGA